MGNKPARCLKTLKMMHSDHPIVVVMGSTGTGKSKLAIELAKKFNGEIISADSMQVYKGLDIITNKVTPAEQAEVPHHLIDYVNPLHTYTVTNFFADAMPVISRLIEEKKLPIIVGGTHYYIEAILWDVLVLNPQNDAISSNLEEDDSEHAFKESEEKIMPNSFPDVSDEVLHDRLRQVDPISASSLHPHNRRKVIRGLQVFQQHGRPLSEILEEQRSQRGGCTLGGPLRFPNAILFWVQSDMEVLMKRLDLRVEDMLLRGLTEELTSFHRKYNRNRSQGPKYTEGIFQSIGFKEFHEFLILSEGAQDSNKQLFNKSIESMKAATRKYAKKQIKWITNRFLRRPDREVPPLYGLNATFLDQWEEAVFKPAAGIVQAKLEGKTPSYEQLPLLASLEDNPFESHYCSACDKLLVGSNTLNAHNNSKKHWKNVARAKKLAELSGLLESLQAQKQRLSQESPEINIDNTLPR